MRPFFSMAVRHDFFPGGRAAVEWEPTESTRRLLDASGCAVAPGRGDLEVFYDAERRDRLVRFLDDVRTPFELAWHWQVPGFDLACISADAPARADDRIEVCDWRADGAGRLTPRPLVRFRPAVSDVPAPESKEGKRYFVRIAARATYWKYFLPAAWPAESVRIVDAAGHEDFTSASTETLADGRAVLCVRSQRPIALAQRPASSFRLTCVEDDVERVLLERLPAAAPGPFVRETVQDTEVPVSEIHV